jgi:outer membrane protein OmpA-like peptidoglycan-associated protein
MAKLFWAQIPIERAAALFYYEAHSETANIIYMLKYKNHPEIGGVMGRMTAKELQINGFFDGIDGIVPVPLAKKRLHQRGYNQSMEIAKGVSEITGLPIYNKVVRRNAFEGSQTNRLNDYHHASVNEDQPAYNINNSMFQLNAGIVYKFSCSNGTHNFKKAELKDQATIDALNAKVNSLREEISARDEDLQAKDREIADLVKALKDCKDSKQPVIVKQTSTTTNLLPTVIFRQGRSSVDPAQFAQIELIASYMKNHPTAHVEIKGYASPEGSVELNQKLSEDRAKAVRDVLVNRYGIAASRLTTVGCGPTSTLFEQVEFNRVATFNDNTKQ